MSRRLDALPAPAKLNIFLHVTGRREDGMHLLESLFVLIDPTDEITLEEIPQGSVERTGNIVGEAQKDLCVRAAHLLQQETGCTKGCRIHVKKRIPAGAGMGGGSSDCATTLMGLNALWNLNLSKEKLMELGGRLGADVPFFLFGENAFARGTGDILTAVDVPETYFAVVMPPQGTPTGLIFQDSRLTRNTKSLKIGDLFRQVQTLWSHLMGCNDLEPVAVRINPQIARAISHLGENARMTGSGSAVFAPCPDEAAARMLLRDLEDGMTGYTVRLLKRHPIFERSLSEADK